MIFKDYIKELEYWGKPYPPITQLIKPNNIVLHIVIGCLYSGIGRLGVNKGKLVSGVLGWNSSFQTFHLSKMGNEHGITPVDIRTLNTL